MARRYLEVQQPVGGQDRNYAFQSQPPFTILDGNNVRCRDVFESRARLGSRPALAKAFPQQLGTGTPPESYTQDFWPTKDTWLYFFNADTPQDPNNASATLAFGHWITTSTGRAILHYDLAAIHPGATVTEAYLSLYRTAANNGSLAPAMKVRRILDADEGWVEIQATWNSRATSTSWSVANARNPQTGPYSTTTPVDLDWTCPIVDGSFTVPGMEVLVQYALTNRSEQLHIMLMSASETATGQLCFIGSSEADPDDPDKRPKLTVTWTA